MRYICLGAFVGASCVCLVGMCTAIAVCEELVSLIQRRRQRRTEAVARAQELDAALRNLHDPTHPPFPYTPRRPN